MSHTLSHLSRIGTSIVVRVASSAALLASSVAAYPTAFAQSPAASITVGVSGYYLDATWKPGGEGGWDYLVIDPKAHRLYVSRTDRVQVIDTAKGRRSLSDGPRKWARDRARTGVQPRVATSGMTDAVVGFDLRTLEPVGEPIAVGKKPDAKRPRPVPGSFVILKFAR